MTQEALSTIKAWNAHPTMETAQLMGANKAATMMLAMRPPQRESLQEESKLCEKKDKIIGLFDTLLAKLGGEELSANITMGKVSHVRLGKAISRVRFSFLFRHSSLELE